MFSYNGDKILRIGGEIGVLPVCQDQLIDQGRGFPGKKTEIFLHSREADDFRVNTDAELLFETVRARRRPDVNDFACSVFNKM